VKLAGVARLAGVIFTGEARLAGVVVTDKPPQMLLAPARHRKARLYWKHFQEKNLIRKIQFSRTQSELICEKRFGKNFAGEKALIKTIL
jgi:hypothetical protein